MTAAALPRRPPTRSLSCLVVEDHTMFLQLLVGMLRTVPGIEVRSTARTAAEAIASIHDEAVDLLVLDLKLPDGDGLAVLRAAVGVRPDIDCIVLSSAAGEFACPQELLPNLRALIDKTQAYEQLQAVIAAVVKNRGIDLDVGVRAGHDIVQVLRPRELDVFRLIGRGLKTADIGLQLCISKNTVETHRKSIAAKLGVRGAELVRLATLHNQMSLPLGRSSGAGT